MCRSDGVANRSQVFLDLSALLTGFKCVALTGTGMTDAYIGALDDVLPAQLLDDLLAVYERLPVGSERDAAVAADILGDFKLGPVARNLILLWYCGTWTALPDQWRATYGTSPLDTDRVVSAQSYQAALQWVVAGAHPAGARQQGYGAWAVAPAGAGG